MGQVRGKNSDPEGSTHLPAKVEERCALSNLGTLQRAECGKVDGNKEQPQPRPAEEQRCLGITHATCRWQGAEPDHRRQEDRQASDDEYPRWNVLHTARDGSGKGGR